MANQVNILRIVAASPGDVQAERDQVNLVVDELNSGIARSYGLGLAVARWETQRFAPAPYPWYAARDTPADVTRHPRRRGVR